MNVFSVNQVTQAYVANSRHTTDSDLNSGSVGGVRVVATPNNESFYIKHKGPGGITRSDIVNVKNVLWTKATVASAMATTLKKATVTLAAVAMSDSKPLAGQDYILRVVFDNYVGISPEDSKYWKYGAVHVTSGMTASNFYRAMALSLVKNMSREAVKMVKISLNTASDPVEVTNASTETSLSGTYTGIILEEVEPDWILGTKQQKVMRINVQPTTVEVTNGSAKDEVIWGSVSWGTSSTTIKNGKLIADYEYFFHGERGDQYRLSSWPNYVPTTYLVDPTKEYDVINIHYAYVGDNESVQKSEKDLVLLVPRAGTDTTASSLGALATNIKGDIDAILNPADSRYVAKVTGTSGNFVAFGSNGAIADSGKKATDFEPAST